MITSTIKFSQIEDRIDAEYYKPEYLILNSKLKSQNSKFLGDLVSKMMYGTSDDIEYTTKGVPLLRITDFDEVTDEIDMLDLKYVPEFLVNKLYKKYQLKKNDLLFSRSGTVGLVALIDEKLEGSIFGSYFIKISPRQTLINPVYLYLFLNSYCGRVQSQTMKIGAVQTNIALPQIASIKIPIPSQSFQQKIEKMVKEAQEKRKLADEKYKEAEEILNKGLGLENLDLFTQKTFEAKFTEAEDRFDPEYYQPKYKKIKKFLSRRKLITKPLKSFVKKYNCGFAFPTDIYLEKGIPLLRIKNLKRMEIDFEGVEFLPDLNEYQEFVAKPGDILISMSGTVGVASLVPANIPKAFVNQRITSISTEGIDKLYLCLYLNLAPINALTNRETTGGVQKNITYQDITSIPVSILLKPTQQKISSLIQESFKLLLNKFFRSLKIFDGRL